MTTIDFESPAVAPRQDAPTRPMYWSIRRELWENRSIYLAPLAVALVVLLGHSCSLVGLAHRRRAVLLLPIAQQRIAIAKSFDIDAIVLLATAFIVGMFYCLDALYGERRDRSILFWKTVPINDRTTVLSKATIPLVILPVITFAMTIIVQLLMLLMTNALLAAAGVPITTNEQYPFALHIFFLAYGLVVLSLWHAPVYAWFLLVSASAKRATLVWAFLPFFAASIFERIAFRTAFVSKFIQYRLGGGPAVAFDLPKDGHVDSVAQVTFARFVTSPGLWLGLLFAAGFLAAAAYMRRNRDPI